MTSKGRQDVNNVGIKCFRGKQGAGLTPGGWGFGRGVVGCVGVWYRLLQGWLCIERGGRVMYE